MSKKKLKREREQLKLIHGDCLDKLKLIPDKSIDLILTDPPFGTTANSWDSIIPLDLMWAELNRVIKPNGKIVLFAQCPFDKVLGASNIKHLKYEWIWEKEQGTGFLNAKKAPLKNHENILVFEHWSKKKTIYYPVMRTGFKPYICTQGNVSKNYNNPEKIITTVNKGERYPLTIIKFNRDKNKIHPTQKPVALLEYLIKTYTKENETVLDFTMGSGSTGVACLNTNRNFIGIEKDDKYFKIASDRIKSHQEELKKVA